MEFLDIHPAVSARDLSEQQHHVVGHRGVARRHHESVSIDVDAVHLRRVAGLWHIVHWRDKHLSAAAQAFRGFLHSQAPHAPRTKR